MIVTVESCSIYRISYNHHWDHDTLFLQYVFDTIYYRVANIYLLWIMLKAKMLPWLFWSNLCISVQCNDSLIPIQLVLCQKHSSSMQLELWKLIDCGRVGPIAPFWLFFIINTWFRSKWDGLKIGPICFGKSTKKRWQNWWPQRCGMECEVPKQCLKEILILLSSSWCLQEKCGGCHAAHTHFLKKM